MIIQNDSELQSLQKISDVVAQVLLEMKKHAKPGMSTKELDDFGGELLKKLGATSAPKSVYKFPGYVCICVNEEIAHGVPSKKKILKEGDLINIDVSAEMDGFFSDNGGSFILGKDLKNKKPLVNASQKILKKAIATIRTNVKISDIGGIVEDEAKKLGYKVIKNLAGHGVGRSLHEDPELILNCRDLSIKGRFKKNSVVAIETFISEKSTIAHEKKDGWTLVGNKKGFVTQHEHTIVVTDDLPIILTEKNGVYDF